jgi:hypothetical protein
LKWNDETYYIGEREWARSGEAATTDDLQE